MMDLQEAIKLLHPDTTKKAIWNIADKKEAIKKIEEACVLACDAMKELNDYQKFGTLEEVREAVEKQKAMPVKKYDTQSANYEKPYFCPVCGVFQEPVLFGPCVSDKTTWCWACGQRLDWSEAEE